MMKIGLINPNQEIKNPSVHLGLAYIASFALGKIPGIEFEIIDTRVANKKETENFFNTAFNLIGITTSTQVFSETIDIATKIKSINPKIPICIGGPHVSTYKEEALEDYPFDYGVFGEGEYTFADLILFLKGEKTIDQINGLIYKTPEGKVISNPPRSYMDDIDSLPMPAYHLFKMDRYPQHRMVSSRGCPFDCVFCNSTTLWSRKWRSRKAEKIVEEMQYLIEHYGRKTFVFNDDSFNIDKKRTLQICETIISKKLDILWTVPIRVDLISTEIADKMKQAGCYSVSIGIESANNEVLRRMNKSNTIEKIKAGIEILKASGMHVTGQFMIGNPGDTLETIRESVEFAKSSGLQLVEFYTALPYKGSGLWQFVNEHAKMLTDKEPYHYHEINPRIVFETPEFPYQQRLEAIQLAVENGYYTALSTDHKSFLLDFGKKIAQLLQKMTSGKTGNKIYLKMREIYRRFF
jgi:anaerobic magnesium-protoporphyrin IX monomethyl ester cyclase